LNTLLENRIKTKTLYSMLDYKVSSVVTTISLIKILLDIGNIVKKVYVILTII